MRSERDLVRGIKQRDPGIFEEFVRRYQQRIYFTALRLVGGRDDALDVAQEVFLKMWRFAPQLSETVMLERWVYRVAVNTCLDRLRHRIVHENRVTHDNLILLSLVEQGMNPRDYAKKAEELNQVKNALAELTDRQRAIFILRHFQNLKIQDIAEILATPVGTVKATLHQTFLKLRGILGISIVEERQPDEENVAEM